MRLVAFDTSTQWCSVAAGDGTSWHQRHEPVGQTHSERVLRMIDEVLAESGWSRRDIDAIAFGAGPGSFTGVRIAAGVAQGLAWGLDRPVLAVGTLAAIAQEALQRHGMTRVLVCTDARMREVYTAAYAREGEAWREIAAPAVMPPDAVSVPDSGTWSGAGNGYAAYPTLAQRLQLAHVAADVSPTACAIGTLALPRLQAGEGGPPEQALPLYVRHRVALTTAERDAGLRL